MRLTFNPGDHAYHNIYRPSTLPPTLARFGLTVAAEALPDELRSQVKVFERRPDMPPYQILGYRPVVNLFTDRQPEVEPPYDWERIERLIRKAKVCNKSPDVIFPDLTIVVEADTTTYGKARRFRGGPPIMPDDTLLIRPTKIIIRS